MFRLPVSGLQVTIRRPTGEDDLFLQETCASTTALALGLVSRLVRPADGSEAQWSNLTITDLEALLLLIRSAAVGDLIEADLWCATPECGERVTASFRISEYLARRPSRPPREIVAEGEGWFRLPDQPVKFRLPAANDLLAVLGENRPDREILRRCMEPEIMPAGLRRRVVQAMAAMAPSLSEEVQGICPECRQPISAYFNIQKYVVEEFRQRAARVHHDVHLLAFNYQWPEESILHLPRERRILYAERLRQEGIG